MNFFPIWWAFVQLPNNDGSSNDSTTDGAGATHWGWTYPTWRAAQLYAGNVATDITTFSALTQDQAGVLAEGWFWNRQFAPSVSPGIAISIIDWTWTSGGAVSEIQAGIGASVSGMMDQPTVAAINAMKTATLIASIYQWRVAYYNALGYQAKYPGLYRRALDCQSLSSIYSGIT